MNSTAIQFRDKAQKIVNQLIADEVAWTCGSEALLKYNKRHEYRFKKTMELCTEHVPNRESVVLDIGPSYLTEMLSSYYDTIYSLGVNPEQDDGGHRGLSSLSNIPHILFDLNEASEVNTYPEYYSKFDMVVFSETIEHLYTAPEYSLLMLAYLLKPDGIIIVTTPNAASLGKRARLLLGINPYERIRFSIQNPGHYREYTRNDLIEIGGNIGLSVKKCYTINLYKRRSIWKRIVATFELIPQFRDSLVAVYEKRT